ncbi:hypothetical protein BA190_09525 [Labrys sp. WJW]|nr:hypothetical protein BA190_09525 [Labrys sp. WJW]
MRGQDFLRWMDVVGARFAGDVAERLGTGRNIAQRWLALAKAGEDVPVQHSYALAMSALASGLKPWGSSPDAKGAGNDNAE